MATFILGDDVVLYIWDSVDTSYKPVGCLTQNDLNLTRNVIEAQTKCDKGLIVRQAGSTSSDISFDATYIKTDTTKSNFNDLLDFINVVNGTTQDWKMSSDQTSPTDYYGTGVLADLSLSSSSGDEFATFSGTIQNSGLITTVDPHA